MALLPASSQMNVAITRVVYIMPDSMIMRMTCCNLVRGMPCWALTCVTCGELFLLTPHIRQTMRPIFYVSSIQHCCSSRLTCNHEVQNNSIDEKRVKERLQQGLLTDGGIFSQGRCDEYDHNGTSKARQPHQQGEYDDLPAMCEHHITPVDLQ